MQLLRKKGMLDSNRVLFLPVDAIAPNPDQPRRVFPQHELEELAASICDNWQKKNKEIYRYLTEQLF